MTGSPSYSYVSGETSTPSTANITGTLKKIPQISNRHPDNNTGEQPLEENLQIRVSKIYDEDDDGDEDEDDPSPIAASMLGLNNIRTRSVPAKLQLPSLVDPLSDLEAIKEANEDNTESPTSEKEKYILPDDALSTIDILGKKATWSQSKSLRFPSPLYAGLEGNEALIKEMQSPRFQAIIRVTSGRKKKVLDIKNFSHELNSKGVRPYPFWKPRTFGHEVIMVMIRDKFDKLKDEVDSDLGIFAGDLVEMLSKASESHLDWREGVEDLLLVARQCVKMPAEEFWFKCESIVQDLDDRRQELPMGVLKRAHIRLLFILTRCTRLVQFPKQGSYEEDHILSLHKLSDLGVYSQQIFEAEKMDSGSTYVGKVANVKHRKKSQRHQHSLTSEHGHLYISSPDGAEVGMTKTPDSSASSFRMSSWKKLPSAPDKHKRDPDIVDSPSKDQHKDESTLTPGSRAGNNEPPSVRRVSWGTWADQQHIACENLIICRICEVEIPAVFIEEHSRICTIADRCDLKGLKVNERLDRVAETLEKILESWTPKCTSMGGGSLEETRLSTSSFPEELYDSPPKKNSLSDGSSDDMLDCIPKGDLNAHRKSSSTGSLTPRSPLTPRTSQIDLLVHKRKTISEHENNQQIRKLVDIARSVANVINRDYSALEYMTERLEELKYSIQDRKVDSLVVETFGRRIEKLLQEKYLQLFGQIDDESSLPYADDVSSAEDDTVRSLRASPLNPSTKERTSIEDFEIIKPISRGAYGRVFLAKKRSTGDLFAIKVLKKADMIRKNAVESILAERNILISIRNPFVVRFYYSFTCKENLYLVMEYLNGGDLYSLLKNLGCLDEDMTRVYMAEVVLALEYLHKLNVIHRDLKPDNLLIGPDGHIKLTDFGLSKVGLINSTDDLSAPSVSSSAFSGDDKPDSTMKQSPRRESRQKHGVIGTPDYLAPEILLGMGHGATADWWSVGVILFELLVGIPPFNADHPQQIFDNIMNRDIPWPKVPEEMSYEAYDLINKLLIENPVQRLGATGSSEIRQNIFFRNINWDTLARQKAMFVPSTEGAYDTSYFMSRYVWNPEGDQGFGASDFDDMSESRDSCSSGSYSNKADEDADECGNLAEFRNNAMKYSFSNFSFKNLSNLASINYDLVVKCNNKDEQEQSEASTTNQ